MEQVFFFFLMNGPFQVPDVLKRAFSHVYIFELGRSWQAVTAVGDIQYITSGMVRKQLTANTPRCFPSYCFCLFYLNGVYSRPF